MRLKAIEQIIATHRTLIKDEIYELVKVEGKQFVVNGYFLVNGNRKYEINQSWNKERFQIIHTNSIIIDNIEFGLYNVELPRKGDTVYIEDHIGVVTNITRILEKDKSGWIIKVYTKPVVE